MKKRLMFLSIAAMSLFAGCNKDEVPSAKEKDVKPTEESLKCNPVTIFRGSGSSSSLKVATGQWAGCIDNPALGSRTGNSINIAGWAIWDNSAANVNYCGGVDYVHVYLDGPWNNDPSKRGKWVGSINITINRQDVVDAGWAGGGNQKFLKCGFNQTFTWNSAWGDPSARHSFFIYLHNAATNQFNLEYPLTRASNGGVVGYFTNLGQNKHIRVLGDKKLNINTNNLFDNWEKFEKIKMPNGLFALRSLGNGYYVRADHNLQYTPLYANSLTIDTWESFKMDYDNSGFLRCPIFGSQSFLYNYNCISYRTSNACTMVLFEVIF